MEYPIIDEIEKSRQMTDVFLGYNHNLRINENEFFDMKNMTSDFYPVLSPRQRRGVYDTPFPLTSPNGLIAKDALCYVDGAYFVINNKRYNMGLSDSPKQLISMGAYVIIMPDKKWFNTAGDSDDPWGDIEAHVTTTSEVSFTLCKADGVEYDMTEVIIAPSAPASPSNNDYWIDTSTSPHTLKQYSETNKIWSPVATTYVKISSPGAQFGQKFRKYDGVTISGITIDSVSDLNTATTIWAVSEDSIIVTGIIDTVSTQDTPICVSRWMPDLDYVIESNNRLWGCKYGIAYTGMKYDAESGETVRNETTFVNEIFACKQGDFFNWNSFIGLSSDSYYVSVGTDGQFTGAASHMGYPCFFKENVMHKVYGDLPSSYQVQDTACRGVQKGSHRSLAIVNETLFYKSRGGICAYDGSLPREVSYQLGNVRYTNAVGVAHGNKYYVSMKDTNGKAHLFVYDTTYNMWHKEDDLAVSYFCSNDDELYVIPEAGDCIITMMGSGTQDDDPVEWSVETGEIGLTSPDMKYLSRMNIRMMLNAGSDVTFYVRYETSADWEEVCSFTGTHLRSFSVPIRPKRCDYMKLKIVGHGEGKIFSITKTIEQGSELS